MDRQATTQDVTWILDLNVRQKLDLDPPYQRKSVWTKKDKQFFVDTVLRNYPSPALFLHKVISDDGSVIYHVIDGKQRIQTLLEFTSDKFSIADDYGDLRLDTKIFSQLETEFKKKIWNYRLSVELIDIEADISKDVNEIFDRLNRNSKKLTRQELRHAKYDGWFASFVDKQLEDSFWGNLGLATAARSKRMSDAQFISELICLTIEEKVLGFNQDSLDKYYARYDNPDDEGIEFEDYQFKDKFHKIKGIISRMDEHNNCIKSYCKGVINFYSLWSFVMLNLLEEPITLANFYSQFMGNISQYKEEEGIAPLEGNYFSYFINSKGANTDKGPREKRLSALISEFNNEGS